ncbi:hypothetical protein K432DRAFT_129673 [Lepidopterella palustris CBS 459.81]|uniref:Uncharacterized protein n=1 Tax=Lepidopterella palustris CBS 459.81 TaxID=1314670 RepID=A0A8E2JC90_9PEZI|nr:hypothetical protein K432DRAFT_129673 [Lepidopterella palustris CBS 459.81]
MADPPAPIQSLTLPPAVLHFAITPHPDSDQHRQNDKHRIANELESIPSSSSQQLNRSRSPNVEPRSGFPPSSLPPNTYPRSVSARSSSFVRARQRRVSEVSTAPDDECARETRRYRLQRQKPHWYDGIVKFWTTQISVTIDEGQHRDHLGMW